MNQDKPQRKIIQVTTTVWQDQHFLYALCDDGTLWENGVNRKWAKVDPIPKDNEEG